MLMYMRSLRANMHTYIPALSNRLKSLPVENLPWGRKEENFQRFALII